MGLATGDIQTGRAAKMMTQDKQTGQSPIFVKTEIFMMWLLNHTKSYPRVERFRLAAQIDSTMFAFHENLIRAVLFAPPKPSLIEADVHLRKLRAYLRIAVELGYTSPDQLLYASQHTTEIGKLLGAWIKSA